ncbi:DUF2515 family protein [Fictibacillus terranigra]|uniref:DUF2515 family protein n=1 Tax=Fictibacillus terranigra TaxID=3058424 RepID=A0ABT8E5P9_9BACL|nr:DUF2515 family protein [Fictibacillus sp. CENA-BCM004]MDN4073220.1 DUF2515 family protein [Fictibacillus sp. CENA-BCM004]
MNTRYRSFSKTVIIPSAFFIRTLRKLIPSKKNILWAIPEQDRKWIRSRLNHESSHSGPSFYYGSEKSLIRFIKEKTQIHNKNNITRTEAYYHFFKNHREVHWAFLAHMVSRNAGYHMTDLKGEFLPRLLNEEQLFQIYWTLETANSLIFQDVYPQLLLYEESKRRRSSLFHLLKGLETSVFMKPVWEHFWEKRESRILTMALIINEQNFIQDRLIHNSNYSKALYSIPFQLQNLLQLTKILFPVRLNQTKLAGISVSGFNDLASRIETGKSLYLQLFHERLHPGILRFADQQPHTGSRSDYWREVFTPDSSAYSPHYNKERIGLFRMKKKAVRLYSPRLMGCWGAFHSDVPEQGDWHDGITLPDSFRFLLNSNPLFIEREHWTDLHHLEGAVLAKQLFF